VVIVVLDSEARGALEKIIDKVIGEIPQNLTILKNMIFHCTEYDKEYIDIIIIRFFGCAIVSSNI
jgi:hypothetical protein